MSRISLYPLLFASIAYAQNEAMRVNLSQVGVISSRSSESIWAACLPFVKGEGCGEVIGDVSRYVWENPKGLSRGQLFFASFYPRFVSYLPKKSAYFLSSSRRHYRHNIHYHLGHI